MCKVMKIVILFTVPLHIPCHVSSPESTVNLTDNKRLTKQQDTHNIRVFDGSSTPLFDVSPQRGDVQGLKAARDDPTLS